MSTFALLSLAALGVATLLVLILWLRLPAFVSLLLTSLLVALLGGVPPDEVASALEEGMGETLGYIAIVVGIGAMFGEMLRVSGGAEQISHTLVHTFGEEHAPWALSLTGLIVAVPVFFDVALILFIPLIYGLTRRTGRSLLFFALPLTAGIAVAHSFIPPTPGPVAVASLIGADLGWVIFFGLLAGVPATILGGVIFGRYAAGRISLDVPDQMADAHADAVDATKGNPQHGQGPPSFSLTVGLIAVPLALILAGTASDVLLAEGHALRPWLAFAGHPFTALIVAALLAFYLLGVRRGLPMDDVRQIAAAGLEPVGLIILVTGAGGVFGHVLIETGVGDALAGLMADSTLPAVLLAFLIAAVVRVSQGSATVSMVTAAGLMAPVVEANAYAAPQLGALTIAIASGATVLSHVNDSGFWLVSRFLGMSEEQTLRTWTVMETIIGLTGLGVALLADLFV